MIVGESENLFAAATIISFDVSLTFVLRINNVSNIITRERVETRSTMKKQSYTVA